MKIIINYVSEDNVTFSTIEECTKYESLYYIVQYILSGLFSDDSISFSNGHGYIQHPDNTRDMLIEKVISLANDYFKPPEPFLYFNYYLNRVVDNSSVKCLQQLCYKISCIDGQNREWGQPYYALYPEKAKNKKLNV